MTAPYQPPEPFARTVRGTFGAAGAAWLADLPALIDATAARWQLTLGAPLPNPSYNLVIPAADADGRAVMLKLGVTNDELSSEIDALRHYDGYGAVRLLAADAEAGALLLDRVTPGTELVTVADDDTAMRIFAQVMARLHRPPPTDHRFITVERWLRGFARHRARYGGGTGPLPRALFDAAEGLARELAASQGPPVLLHGDLHHYNILKSGESWVAIDPKGVVGERAYEVGTWLRNPLPPDTRGPLSPARLARRLDVLAEALGEDRARLLGWGVAQAVLSTVWSLEDGGDPAPAVGFAEALASLLPG